MGDAADRGIKVNFNQGLDIRLLTPRIMDLLLETKYYNWKFTGRQLHFAFDHPKDERAVRKGVEMLLDAGIRPRRVMVYLLCDFNTTFEEDMYRFNILWKEYGVYPYVQIFNRDDRKRDRRLLHFARWVNRRIHKICEFEDYEPWVKEMKEMEENARGL